MVAQFLPRHQQQQQSFSTFNIEAEEAILGGLLFDNSAWQMVIDTLEPEHFYMQRHQVLYKNMKELYQHKKTSDFISIKDYLQQKQLLQAIGGERVLFALGQGVVSTVNMDRYAELVIKKWCQRDMIRIANNLIDLASSDLAEFDDGKSSPHHSTKLFLEEAEKQLFDLTRSRYREDLSLDSEIVQASKLIAEIKEIENTIVNPAFKNFKMSALAKKYKLPVRQLETIYYKALIADEDEPIQLISEFRKKFGNEVNEWFLHGLLPKGSVILLHALGGVGKSRLAYDFCFSLATGTAWNQFPVTAPERRCLIVQTDETTGDLLRALDSRGFTDEPVFIKTRWTVDHIASLRKEIIEHKVEMVIIDSLTTVSRSSTFSENDTEYAKPVLQLKDLAQELGVSIVLIHHSNSEGKSRGTKAVYNSVSQVLSLKFTSSFSDASSTDRLLCIEKSRFRRPTQYKLAYTMNEETHQWSWVCEGENTRVPDVNGSTKDLILDFLSKQRNTPLQATEVHERLGGSYHSIRRSLYQLSTDGLVTKQRLTTRGRPWTYLLKWDVSDHCELSDLCDLSDQNGQKKGVIKKKAAQGADSSVSDHLIANNDRNLSDHPSSDIDHSVITNEQSKAESPRQPAIQPTNVSDHKGDSLSDHKEDSLSDHKEDSLSDHKADQVNDQAEIPQISQINLKAQFGDAK